MEHGQTKRNGLHSLPVPGQRIVRSVIAVALCFVVYELRGRREIPFYSALAVLQCMQPYKDSTLQMAKKRTTGTFVGAFWGLVLIVIEVYVTKGRITDTFFSYLLIALFTGVVLYSTVVMKISHTAYFSCVVFLSITVMHITDESPLLFVLNRVFDTLLGVALGFVVNSFHLPRKKNRDVLYVSGLDDTLLGSGQKLSSYSKVELNRVIDEGAQFTVATLRTPASIRESLEGVHLKLPVVAMDGAVLYDMKENSFLMSYQMSYRQAKKMIGLLDQRNCSYFTNVVIEDMLVIYYGELQNDAQKGIYEQMRRSPYRNYVKRPLPEGEEVVYFMLIEKEEVAQKLYEGLKEEAGEDYRMICYPAAEYPGYNYIKIYHKDASREHMLQNLQALLDMDKKVTFGSIKGKYDVYIENSDRNVMVKELKKQFEPVRLLKK